MSRQLSDLRLAVMMLDGLELKGRMYVVALGITTEGVKIPLGLWEGSTENATLVATLLSDLVERGLDPEQGMLFVLDGSKALRKAVQPCSARVPVKLSMAQRTERHRPAARARPPTDQGPAPQGVDERPTITARASSSTGSPTSSTTPVPAPPARYGKGWTRRSR